MAKKPTTNTSGMNPHKERRELGQKSPKPNPGMMKSPTRKPMPRGR